MKFLSVILLSFFSCIVVCQLPAQSDNLIPDPSAESMIECPEHLGGYAEDGNGIDRYVPYWISMRWTPDYFNSCSEQPLLGWNNIMGNQNPRTGNGYLGAYVYDSPEPDYREIFGTAFTMPMIIGVTYRITFHVALAVQENQPPTVGYLTGLTANNLGFLLLTETSANSLADGPLPNRATFHLDSAIIDTTNWTEISFVFVADSAYSHIAFGNFFEDDSTEASSPFDIELPPSAYFFFDDFCVTQVDQDCSYILSDDFTEFSSADILLYPNPTSSRFSIHSMNIIKKIAIYDLDGRLIRDFNNIDSGQISLNANLNPGVYLVRIYGTESKMVKKLVVQP